MYVCVCEYEYGILYIDIYLWNCCKQRARIEQEQEAKNGERQTKSGKEV